MEAKYTPGPWEAVEGSEAYGPWIILLPNAPLANHIAYISNGGVDESQEAANARLIAAAPALVEALKEARSVLAMMVEPGAIQQTTVINAYAAAKAAEAKARLALSQALGGE